jgi:hypothetical protein
MPVLGQTFEVQHIPGVEDALLATAEVAIPDGTVDRLNRDSVGI